MIYLFTRSLPVLAALVLIAFGPMPAAHAASTTLKASSSANYDHFLADSGGHPIYVFGKDKQGKGGSAPVSACSGKCASAWPPVVAPITAGKGVNASLIGSMTRKDGTKQATYNGWPLYRFVRDKGTGEPQGEGLEAYGEVWYLMMPNGKRDEEDAD